MTSSPESDVVPAVPTTPGVAGGKSEDAANTPSPTPSSTNGYGSMSLSSVASTMTDFDSLLSGHASLPPSSSSDVSTSTTCLSERSDTTTTTVSDSTTNAVSSESSKPRTTRAISDLGKLPDPNDVWGDDKEDQEWILLFDSLLKHAGKKLKACECHPDEAPSSLSHNHHGHGSPYSYRKFSTGDHSNTTNDALLSVLLFPHQKQRFSFQ